MLISYTLCLPVCVYSLRRADVQTLVSGYLVERTCRVRQGNSTPHPCWTIKRTQTDRNYVSSIITGDYWCLLHFYILPRKELFYWVGVRSDNAEDDDILLQNGLAVPFTVRRELNSFEVIFCFMDKTCNTCIELGIVPLPLAGTGCNGFCTGQELSSKQPILILYLSSHIHLFKMADLGGGSFKYF